NEVTDDDWSIDSYSRMFAEILLRLRKVAPQASILVYGPPDRADNGTAIAKMPAMIQAQRNAAINAGAAFWSSYGAMGGAGSINNWASQGLAQGDRVHLSSAGYTRMGSMFYEDIIDAFKKYQARPQRNNNTRPNRGRGQ
ncbi:MAG: hypothetical protein ICV68_09425, partial [Pyrinomonadaceae bacterium]|nr:hypothetical protein [Pyrinomonadaceae bacterium]